MQQNSLVIEKYNRYESRNSTIIQLDTQKVSLVSVGFVNCEFQEVVKAPAASRFTVATNPCV
jgi:hypothetical protein